MNPSRTLTQSDTHAGVSPMLDQLVLSPTLNTRLGAISVVNVRTAERSADNYYIGRPSTLGNPFVIGVDGSRDEVVAQYERWLRHHMRAATPTGDNVRTELRRIKARCEQGFPVKLGCFCAPAACHGDVIKRIIESEEI